jgi:hypothetical protein
LGVFIACGESDVQRADLQPLGQLNHRRRHQVPQLRGILAGTASLWAKKSPVLITRSGFKSAKDLISAISVLRFGVKCRSEKCSTRIERWPAGRTGTVTSRS